MYSFDVIPFCFAARVNRFNREQPLPDALRGQVQIGSVGQLHQNDTMNMIELISKQVLSTHKFKEPPANSHRLFGLLCRRT